MGACSVSPSFSTCFTFWWVGVATEQLLFLAVFLERDDDAPIPCYINKRLPFARLHVIEYWILPLPEWFCFLAELSRLIFKFRCPFHNVLVYWLGGTEKDFGLQFLLYFLATMPIEPKGKCCIVFSW